MRLKRGRVSGLRFAVDKQPANRGNSRKNEVALETPNTPPRYRNAPFYSTLFPMSSALFILDIGVTLFR
jgi:hypothetical protein